MSILSPNLLLPAHVCGFTDSAPATLSADVMAPSSLQLFQLSQSLEEILRDSQKGRPVPSVTMAMLLTVTD